MSVDVRTRLDGQQAPFDSADFFAERLPEMLHARGDLLEAACRALAPPSLEIEVDGQVWALVADAGRIGVRRGPAEGSRAIHLRLDAAQLSDLVDDHATPMGWFSSGRLDLDGRLERLLDWWLLVRGALDGVAPHVASTVEFTDGHGEPLTLDRCFQWDDDDQEMLRFLEQAGFLHVSGAFSEDEMAALSRDMDAAAPSYAPGDGRSWWARTGDGSERLVRMQGFDQLSDAAAALLDDERLARLGALPGDGHQRGGMDGNAMEALVKPIGVVQGISDVPWHKDCSLGRHSYECCSLTVGISVTGADAASGQLRVVAGSHRVLVWPALRRRDDVLPEIDLPTGTGDVTVHLSCTLHMAQPPVARERRVLYTGLRLPQLLPEAAAAARHRLREVREAAPVTVSQPPS